MAKLKQVGTLAELQEVLKDNGITPGITIGDLVELNDEAQEELASIDPIERNGYFSIPIGGGLSVNLGRDAKGKQLKTIPKAWDGVLKFMSGFSAKLGRDYKMAMITL